MFMMKLPALLFSLYNCASNFPSILDDFLESKFSIFLKSFSALAGSLGIN